MVSRIKIVYILLAILSLLSVLVKADISNAALLCESCHGSAGDNRPVDAAYRNITTGGFQGNHRTHMMVTQAPATAGTACVKCHNNGVYTSSHRDGVIQLSSNINNSPTAAQYQGVTFKNQTSVPTLGACTNVNCHFTKTTPSWGAPSLASQKTVANQDASNTCQTCHGTTTGNGLSNAHGKHLNYYGTPSALNGCNRCHLDYYSLTGTAAFSHATSTGAGNTISIDMSADPNNANGTISGKRAYPTYMQGAVSGATCNTTYCHSNGTSATPTNGSVVPTWGTTTTACTSCHNYTLASGSPLTTGSHTQHINNAALIGKTFSCDQCHKGTTKDGVTIASYSLHVNRAINVNMTSSTTFTGTYTGDGHAPGAGFGNCANTICHNIGRAGTTGGTAAATVTWGTPAGANKCSICHGAGNPVGSPDYNNGGTGAATANSHPTHALTKGIGCAVCHINTTTNSTTIVAGGGSHLNGNNQDVAFGPFKTQPAAGSYITGTKTCSSTYCHGSGTPLWGAPRLNCRGCHGGDAVSSSPIATGKHTSHTNNTAIGLGMNFQCAACHAKTVSFGNNTSITTQTNHVNGLADYSGVRAGGSTRYSTATKQCTNIYCHSNGNPGAIVYQNPAAWSSATTYNCNGCHGTSGFGAPDYANGGAGTATANSHPAHVTKLGYTDTTGCAVCHVKTANQTTAIKFKDYTAANYHLNGTPNVIFKQIGSSTGTMNGSLQCSNTYCHGTGPTVAWGTPGPLACNNCHSANYALAGAHQIHVQTASIASSYGNMSGNISSTTQYRFSCAACHSPAKGAKHANGMANANGAAEVFYGFTSAVMKGSYTYGGVGGTDNGFAWSAGGTGCNTTYCHSNGQNASGLTTVAWTTTTSTGTCVQCHDTKQTVVVSGLSAKHDKHMNPSQNTIMGLGNGFNCIDCHAKTVSGNITISDKSKHINRFVDFSSPRGGGSARYNAATKTCTNIYCHSNGNPGSLVYVNPVWNGAAMTCTGCHGTTGTYYGGPDYANGGVGTATANSHPKHVTALTITSTTGCAVCHVKTADSTVANKFKDYSAATYHLNKTPNVIFNTTQAGSSASYASATAACSNIVCHGSSTPKWGETSNCDYCHPRSLLSGAHQYHIDATAAIPAVYLNLTGNKSAGQKYNYGCSICHPLTNSSHTSGTIVLDFRPAIAGSGNLRAKNGGAITAQATAKSGQAYPGGASGVSGTAGGAVYCDNVYCHSNGGGSGGTVLATTTYYQSPAWNGTITAAQDKCSMCHGNMPNSSGSFGARLGSPAHYNNTWLGYANVSSGHSLGFHDKNIFTGSNGLVGKTSGSPSSHGNPALTSTLNCSVCHNLTIATSANDKNNVCVKCHYSGNTAGALAHNPGGFGSTTDMQLIANTAYHVNGTLNISFKNMTGYAIAAQVRTGSWKSYSSSWRRPSGYKTTNSAEHWNPKKTPSYSAGTCSNVACHNGQPVNWNGTGGTTGCQSCHTGL